MKLVLNYTPRVVVLRNFANNGIKASTKRELVQSITEGYYYRFGRTYTRKSGSIIMVYNLEKRRKTVESVTTSAKLTSLGLKNILMGRQDPQ